MQTLTAISPIDGRYRDKVESLANYFSESALIRYRIMVEIEYFIALCEIPLPQLEHFDHKLFEQLKEIYLNFTTDDAQRVKDIEKVTNHDVKAVEYFIKEKFDSLNLHEYKEFIHFGLTSQDINNTAVPCSLRDAVHDVYYPAVDELIAKLEELAEEWKDVPMLAKTHGQPASPTRLGKEIQVFVYRLTKQVELLRKVACSGKFGGATGNFNAHHVAYPDIDWVAFANYFKQKIKAGEVGSSAMPHKVNPIDFENSEGNLGIANALLDHLANKLPISRLQRDLTDSTVLRNVGVPLAHTIIAFKSTLKGLNKLIINRVAIESDLEDNWAVVAEAIQTVLRREGYPNPYEALKALTRTNSKITQTAIAEFIDTLDVPGELKEKLKQISPFNYTGIKQ